MIKNTYSFKDKTAVITGGAQGFGLDIAKKFLKFGAKVIIWDIDSDLLDKVKKDLNDNNLSSYIVDVSKFEIVKNTVDAISNKFIGDEKVNPVPN